MTQIDGDKFKKIRNKAGTTVSSLSLLTFYLNLSREANLRKYEKIGIDWTFFFLARVVNDSTRLLFGYYGKGK